MNRREFLSRAGIVATWAAIPIAITACGSDYGSSTQPQETEPGDLTGSVGTSGGHSHSVKITRAQIEAGNAVTLTLSGGGHTHTVTLTSDEVRDIGEGKIVNEESSNDRGHMHSVRFN